MKYAINNSKKRLLHIDQLSRRAPRSRTRLLRNSRIDPRRLSACYIGLSRALGRLGCIWMHVMSWFSWKSISGGSNLPLMVLSKISRFSKSWPTNILFKCFLLGATYSLVAGILESWSDTGNITLCPMTAAYQLITDHHVRRHLRIDCASQDARHRSEYSCPVGQSSTCPKRCGRPAFAKRIGSAVYRVTTDMRSCSRIRSWEFLERGSCLGSI